MKYSRHLNLLVHTALLLTTLSLAGQATASEGAKTKPVFIRPGVVEIEVKHQGKPVTLMREQEKGTEIIPFYRTVTRGKIQPMHPFSPHAVETIGELEMMDYIQQMSNGDDSILIMDSRKPIWLRRSGMIPGAVNIPFTTFKKTDSALKTMEDRFNVTVGETFDFRRAKTLVIYCNGAWCPQSGIAIRKLLKMGYPAANIKYYRGGIQSWLGLGLTVVHPE